MPITKLPIVAQFVLKQFAKKSARKTGIAQLLKASDPVVKSNVRNIEIILKNMGIDPKNLTSTDDVLNAMNYHKAMVDQHLKKHFQKLDLGGGWTGIKSLEKKPKVTSQGDPEFQEITDKLLEKKKYDDITKKMWKDRPFPGANLKAVPKITIDEHITFIKSKDPIESMKEANKVIKREGRYKNLTNEESQKILKDTDDHIFERDIKPDEFDPDYASGGRVPLMYGGDPGFAFEYGGSWADWHDQHRDQMPVEQYIKTKLPKHRLPFREMQSGGLAYMLGEPTYMKYSIGGSVGHAPWHMPTGHKQPEAQQETPTPHVAGTPDPLKAPRGLPSVAPKNMDPAYIQQQMMQKAMMGQGSRPMANEGGRIGFEEGHKVPEEFLEHLKRKNLHKLLEEHRRWKEDYERRKDLAPTQEAAEGGRIGFDKGKKVDLSKRRFLKGTGAAVGLLSMLPFVGKFFKPAAKALGKFKGTPNLVVDITKTPNMPEWYIPLIKKVLNKGDDITDTAATAERQRVHRDILPDGDEVTVTQNIDNQTIDVSVANPKNNYLSASGAGESPYTIQYSKGKVIEEGKYKGQKEPDKLEVDEPYVAHRGPDDSEIEFDVMNYNPKAEVHDTSVLETYATGKKVKPRGTGEIRDPWEGFSPDLKADDYAKGGLAYMLGE